MGVWFAVFMGVWTGKRFAKEVQNTFGSITDAKERLRIIEATRKERPLEKSVWRTQLVPMRTLSSSARSWLFFAFAALALPFVVSNVSDGDWFESAVWFGLASFHVAILLFAPRSLRNSSLHAGVAKREAEALISKSRSQSHDVATRVDTSAK